MVSRNAVEQYSLDSRANDPSNRIGGGESQTVLSVLVDSIMIWTRQRISFSRILRRGEGDLYIYGSSFVARGEVL